MLPEQVYEALVAAADGVDPAEATWEELKPKVLEAAGVSSEEDDPMLWQVVSTIEQSPESEQRELLGSTDRMWQMVTDAAASVEAAPGDASETAAEPAAAAPYWDGEKWLTFDTASGEWVPMEPVADASPAAEEGPAAATETEAAAPPARTTEEIATEIYNTAL
ncbi:MAG TPA: hypothetical protein VH134_07575, partial [Candidatus Dormibacteraeota bacterium]|nr:hypothetical protein [Candidatus Dormibacteraeota bacterium]